LAAVADDGGLRKTRTRTTENTSGDGEEDQALILFGAIHEGRIISNRA